MSLDLADIIPLLTEPPKPNGLPIAITVSPTLALSESPNATEERSLSELILSTARSVLAS